MSEKEQQFERIYKETENFGRTQFVREIQMQINDNKKKDKEIERLNIIINELEKCVQNYIYAIEPRGCSINYNCEYDSEEDYINAMK